MTYGDVIRSVLTGVLQPAMESRMTDTIRFAKPGAGEPVWDGTKYVTPDVEVYNGPFRFRSANPAPQDAEAGEAAYAVDRTPTVHLPLSDPRSANVADGHRGVVTAVGPGSAAYVGMVVTVLTGHWQTDSTARRIPVQVVSRDAGRP